MAKTEVLDWGSWWKGELRLKVNPDEIIENKFTKKDWKKLATKGLVVVAGITFALHGFDVSTVFAAPDAVTTMASGTAEFADQLRKATKPIRDIIFAFGHEIYFVMMAWGGIEALIGKTQQGFARMKAATAAYVVLYWVPWIVGTVNAAVPHN